MPKRDYYEVLGVSRNADKEEIQRAYRRLARELHPDVRPGDKLSEERFKEINEAYRVLSDDAQRARYDRYGTVEDVPAPDFVADPFSSIGEIFDMFFGGTRTSQRRTTSIPGEPVEVDLHIDLKDALTGVRKDITFVRQSVCDGCGGTGAKPGSGPTRCSHCGGAGQVTQRQRSFFGTTFLSTPCPVCMGEGHVVRDPCTRCRGSGRMEKTVKHSIDIPKGIEDGATLQVPGAGHDGLRGGQPGDLFIRVGVRPHKKLKRRGTELFTEQEVSFGQLALGDVVTVQGVEGPVEVEIKPGTQPGTEIRVRGAGMPALGRDDRGDLHVLLRLVVPTELTEKQKQLLIEFEKTLGRTLDSRKRSKSFFEQFKETLRGEDVHQPKKKRED